LLLHPLRVRPKQLLVLAELHFLGDAAGRDHVEKEIESFVLTDDFLNVASLKSFALIPPCVECCFVSQLSDEHLARKREQDRGLARNHADVLVTFHYLLNAGQWQLLLLEGI